MTFARESETDMNNDTGKFRRAVSRGARVLNWAAFIILFIFIGIAVTN
jgi:t-SNARE complex subunit (syntaxin)